MAEKYVCTTDQRIQVQVINQQGIKKLVGLKRNETVESAMETPHLRNLVAAGFLAKVNQ